MCCLFPALLRVGAECINNGHLEKPRRRQWQSRGQRSLEGCSPWSHEESHTTERDFTFTFHFHALEKEMATHSSVLAWRIPGTGEPGGLPSIGLHRVGHDSSDLQQQQQRSLVGDKRRNRHKAKGLKKKSWRQKEKLSLGAACSGLFFPSLAPAAGFLPPLAPNIPSNTEEAPMSLAIRAGSLIQTT